MKKRLFALLLSTCLLLALLPSAALGISFGNWEYTLSADGSAEITAYHGNDAALRVPDSLETHSVTSIAYAAFASAGSLKSVELPTGLKSIGDAAFASAKGLQSVIVPAGLQHIGSRAFYGCDSLRAVCFTGNAPTLGETVFYLRDAQSAQDTVLPRLTLYYLEGTEGWTSPTWNGYRTATWDGKTVPQAIGADNFTDVKPGAWYYNAVDYAVKKGLFNGISETVFEPDTPMTRAMLVTVLWRYENVPKPAGSASFRDVERGKWYTDAVLWAAENGIVNGIGDGQFNPMGKVTREQMAAILFRYCDKKGIDTAKRGDLSAFPDAAQIGSYAKDAFSWAVAEGYIGGSKQNGRNYLDPKGSATRAQVATILMRFLQATE